MFQGVTEKVKLIFYINLVMFIAQTLTSLFHIPLTENLALYDYRTGNFQFYQLISHMFLHGGLIHLLFNMLAFITLAPAVESEYGSKKFLFYYFMSGLCAALLHMFLIKSNSPMVGASGAIYGIMMLFAIIHPNEKLYFFGLVGFRAKYLIPLILLLEVSLGLMNVNDNIAHFAHVGGALSGFIFGFYEKLRRRKNVSRFYRIK